jgi:hypothetical protein
MGKGKIPQHLSSAYACARVNHTNTIISVFAINLAVIAHSYIVVIYSVSL